MPELIHEKNCLLSCNHEQMLENLIRVINTKELRLQIDKNAKSTKKNYAPKLFRKTLS